MERNASNVKNVKVCLDQSYEWGICEQKGGKIRRWAHIDYYWHGDLWRRVAEAMKAANMPGTALSFYKGAQIDEVSRVVRMRGEFNREAVQDKHRAFWRSFFRCPDRIEPTFVCIGKVVKLPSIAGDNDSLYFFVDGQSVSELLSIPVDEDA